MIAIRTARKGAAIIANSTAVAPDRSRHSSLGQERQASRAWQSEIRALGSCMAGEIRSGFERQRNLSHPCERTVFRHGPFSRSTLTAEKPRLEMSLLGRAAQRRGASNQSPVRSGPTLKRKTAPDSGSAQIEKFTV